MSQATSNATFQLSAAEAFVLAHGSPRQRAYWKAAFGWGPVEVWLFEVEHHQGPRGGWGNGLDARDGGRPDTVEGTATALRWLAWLNLGEDIFEVLPRTLAFLEAYQADDGSWGDVATTAMIAAYLAFLGELPERVERATAYVLAHPEAAVPFPVRALELSLLRGRAPELVERREVELLAAVEADGLGTVELAWIHEGAVQAGRTPQDPLRAAIAPRLLQRQQPDGSFVADDPRWDAVDTTFFAARGAGHAVKFRRPAIEDLDDILALINDPASPHRQEACRHREQPENPKELYARLDEDDNLVMELEGEVVGYASWQVWDTHAHLNILSVSGRHQRQGLGRALFNAFRQQAREDGVESYTLRAFADSPWAMGFYRSIGLKPLTPVQELAPQHPGLQLYLAMAVSHGQWPAPEKVMYFEAL